MLVPVTYRRSHKTFSSLSAEHDMKHLPARWVARMQ